MTRISTLLFDFDGTLADTTGTILKAMRMTLDALGLPQTDEKQIKSSIGLPLHECIKRAGNIPDELGEKAAEYYHLFFRQLLFGSLQAEGDAAGKAVSAKPEGAPVLYEGVKETLEALHGQGYVLGITTSRKRVTLLPMLENFGIRDLFGSIVTADDIEHPKPAPDTVLRALGELDRKPEETLVVGDATYDIEMGRRAGCSTCGVSFGNQGRALLETVRPDRIIDSMRELPAVIVQLR